MNSFDEPYMWEPIACPECVDIQNKLLEAQKWLGAALEKLYSSKELDVMALENDLDELCFQLDMNLQDGDLLVERKKPAQLETIQPLVQEWVEYNNQHLKQHARRA